MKRFFKSILLPASLLFSLGSQAQEMKHCGTHVYMNELFKKHPEYKSEIERIDGDLQKQAKSPSLAKNNQKYIVPVVFHIIHNYGAENISDAQVRDALAIVNEDFNKMNADTSIVVPSFQNLIGKANIEFRLANKDPYGNCTNGIERISSPKTYSAGDQSKLNPWPRERYLNIWIVNSIGSAGVAGYAYKPSGAGQGMMFLYDGIIILHDYVGSIGTGAPGRSRALTHEIGHYLGLDHPWGPTNEPGVECGDDGIDDTPFTEGSTSCILNLSVCDAPIIENVQNFMDYSYCSVMYTPGQCALMRLTLQSSTADRNLLSTPANLNFTGVADPYVASTCIPIADFSSNRSITCTGEQVQFADQSWNADVTNLSWTFSNATPSTSTSANPTVVFNTWGWQTVTLTASNSAGSDVETRTSYIFVANPYSELMGPATEDFNSDQNYNWFWKNNNSGNDAASWRHVANYGRNGNNGCVMLNSYESGTGEQDELITPSYNLDFITGPKLEFYYSCGSGTAVTAEMLDKLSVQVSTDCGKTWTQRLLLQGATLVNAGYYGGQYYPNDNSVWSKGTVALPASASAPNVRFKFVYTCGGFTSNNLYIDDINITGASGGVGLSENDLSKGNFGVFPNPTSAGAEIRFSIPQSDNVQIQLLDVLGKKVADVQSGKLAAGQHSFTISPSQLNQSGLYFVRVQSSAGVTTRRLVVED